MVLGWKSWFWRWRGVAIATPSVTLVVLLLRFTGLLQSAEWQAYDQFMRLKAEPPDDRIIIVGITEGDLRELNQVVLPDAIYADAIEAIARHDPRAIGLDIYRDVPVGPGTDQLDIIYQTTPNLVGIRKVAGETERDTVSGSATLAELGQIGANDVLVDADNTVRRGLLQINTPEGTQLPSFGLYLALLYLDAEGIGPEMVGDTDFWRLNDAVFRPFEANDGAYIRANAEGYQTLINFRGGSQHIETVSLRSVLSGEADGEQFRNRIVLIGPVAESLKDYFFVPHSSGLLSLAEPMAGVEIHANIASQIISAALDNRPLIRSWPEVVEIAWIFVWAAVGAVLTWQFRNPGKRLPIRLVAALSAAAISLSAIAYGALLAGWWIPVIPPMLALVGAAGSITAYLAHGANQIRQTFGRYLSDQVVANLLDEPDKLKLGGENRVITILTSDLRGFTALSERLRPEQVVEILNLYLGFMSDVVNRYEGTIDEFMGDGILILFGAPNAQPDAADRAVACAIAMQAIMPEVNTVMRARGYPEQEMGIGINTGEVVVGNIGSERRTKYSVIGSAVNLAFRIESYTTGGQILISDDTRQQVENPLTLQGATEVYPKGIKRPITIHDVIGIGGEYDLSLETESLELLPLTPPIPVEYVALDGKQVGAEHYPGTLQKLSAKTALLHISNGESLNLLTNIKLLIAAPTASDDIRQSDIYAKVQSAGDQDQTYIITFTARAPVVVDWMNQQISPPVSTP
ncbi:MAG: adenylate/guanylate cyclase domain-containing protein [Cyanobacteria bacterium J06628_6]